MNKLYRIVTALLAPLVPLWLMLRAARGKEDPKRLRERYGYASVPRPKGTLMWLHAASVGEANSVLMLIDRLRARLPQLHILLTTGTVTSAQLMKSRLPKGVLHQFVPVDTPQATYRFLRHWKPNLAFFVESELWPNLVWTANYFQCFMGVINARMSERSFASWQKRPAMIQTILSCFDVLFVQTQGDAQRLQALGAGQVMCLGNLKFDAALLSCDEAELLRLKNAIGNRPTWLAASTHPGEEEMMAQAHRLLSATRPNLLTLIVPRHPSRGPEIARALGDSATLRSRQDAITPQTRFYIADTLGELGLFYRLSGIVFMGGSLVRRGGQNPLEPARLSCAIVTGEQTQNFADIYQAMETAGAAARAKSAAALAAQVDQLFNQPDKLHAMQKRAREWVESQGGATDRLLAMLVGLLLPKEAS